jgi:3-oxoacyl-[acyl-carrier-protein] synthase II
MMAGGSESTLCALALGGFASMKALSTRNDQPEKASRPFDKGRDGFLMAEGSAVLILEEKEFALKRGAKIYAELVGYGSSSDAFHITAPAPGGDGGKRSMLLALKDAKLDPGAVDYINSHSTSTSLGDLEEARAIASVFENNKSSAWVSGTKSMTGHLLGAAGALEAFLCIKSIQDNVIPGTINLDQMDPDIEQLGLEIVKNHSREKKVNAALTNSFGFGGANVSLIFQRFT